MITILRNCLILLLVCLNSTSLFGCGGDEDTSENLVGTWELVTIGGKTPNAYFQQDIGDEAADVVSVAAKLVFASNGSLFREASFVISWEDPTLTVLIPDFGFKMNATVTVNGSYVVSGSTVEFISGDRVNVDIDFSINTGGIPEFAQLEQDLKESAEELSQEAEQELAEEFGLDLETWTWSLEGDILTLSKTDGSEEVYRKK